MLMAHLLSSEGYQVTTASDGHDARNQSCEVTPSVILLDLEMPVMDGRGFRQHHSACADRFGRYL